MLGHPRRLSDLESESFSAAARLAIESGEAWRKLETAISDTLRIALAEARLIQLDDDHAVVRAATDAAIATSVAGGTESEVKDAIAEVFDAAIGERLRKLSDLSFEEPHLADSGTSG